eukprot:829599-Amorphochlora_amoeboformis.AAC.1
MADGSASLWNNGRFSARTSAKPAYARRTSCGTTAALAARVSSKRGDGTPSPTGISGRSLGCSRLIGRR